MNCSVGLCTDQQPHDFSQVRLDQEKLPHRASSLLNYQTSDNQHQAAVFLIFLACSFEVEPIVHTSVYPDLSRVPSRRYSKYRLRLFNPSPVLGSTLCRRLILIPRAVKTTRSSVCL